MPSKDQRNASVAKEKMRTSEDVYNRIRWDESFGAHDDIIIGYEDRIEGPMEMNFSAFVPLSDGGNIPFHRLWYFRREDQDVPLWDRRRRLDQIFNSGETSAIIASLASTKPVKGFDQVADRQAAMETAENIRIARATMSRLEEERLELMEKKRREKARKAASSASAKLQNATDRGAIADLCELVDIRSFNSGCIAKSTGDLRIATWNALCDDHPVDGIALSEVRAPRLAEVLADIQPDVVALQEMTGAAMEAILTSWEQLDHPFWVAQLDRDLAILSRHPITQAMRVKLGPAKNGLLAKIFFNGRPIAFSNFHLTSDRRGDEVVNNSEKRRAQVKQVRAALSQFAPGIDTLMCGDFNEPSADGTEAGVVCMQGLEDGWLAVHGNTDMGYTFDPTRNVLADLGALNRNTRRLDRIFASPCFKAHSASLLGEHEPASDHFGVQVVFRLESVLLSQPVVTSALAIVPPKETWNQIKRIREQYDPSFLRWMPHINLVYGFLPEEHFASASLAAEKVTRRHGPIEVILAEIAIFEHGKSASLVLLPSSKTDIAQLQADLAALYPTCASQAHHSFNPHLSIGSFDSVDEARRVKAELEVEWTPLSFVIEDVSFLARSGDKPFHIPMRLHLGPRLNALDVALLQSLESCTGTRAFPIGSAILFGSDRSADSDFDILLVGTEERDVVFDALEHLEAEWTRRPDAAFPIVQMQIGSVQLDIQYARSSNPTHPLFWASCIDDDDCHSVAALWDNYAIRSAIVGARGFRGLSQYLDALQVVKKWAKSRGISKCSLGYLGGLSWALLLANTALASDAPLVDASPDSLASAMWRRFAAWDWSEPVVLHANKVSTKELMPILTPAECVNSARHVTESTLSVLQTELQLAASGVKLFPVLQEVIMSFPKFICCEVHAPEHEKTKCGLWLEARLILLIRKLGSVKVRPINAGAGLYLIGIAAEDLGLPLVQRVVLSLLSMPSPYDEDEGNKLLQELDPSVTLQGTALTDLIEQLSKAEPYQHCCVLESFGLDVLTEAGNAPRMGPPSLERLVTAHGGIAVPNGVSRDWVELLLNNWQMRSTACASSFKKYARRGDESLREEDTLAFCQEVCRKLGIVVATSKLEKVVAQVHRKSNDGLSLDEFSQFFDRFLHQLSTQLPKDSLSEKADAAVDELQSLDVIEAVEQFKAIVARGEWSSMIHISFEDSRIVQSRV